MPLPKSAQGIRFVLSRIPDQATNASVDPDSSLIWRVLLGVGLVLLSIAILTIPFLASGSELWLGIDWIDGRKLYSIDDAYRYFVAKNAVAIPTVLIWNFILPVALLFDTIAATLTHGNLLGMRLFHAGVGVLTLLVIARASLRSGCGPVLALASVLIVGLMPIYLIVSSSFYGEGFFALLVATTFLLLIDERGKLLAAVVGLLPLVRPEGAIYCILFLVYFGTRRDAKSCALIALPGMIYLSAVFLFSTDWVSSIAWRLELRKIISPLSPESIRSVSLDRLPSPLWVCLALVPLFMHKYRRWWPILVGPWCMIGMQAWTIGNEIQDFEIRLLFSTFPVFAVAWAFPIRHAFDASATMPWRRRTLALSTTVGLTAVIAVHMLQSDWIRLYMSESETSVNGPVAEYRVGRDFDNKTIWFDSTTLRSFAARVDNYVDTHDDVRTIFITNSQPMYFLNFLNNDPNIELVLIPHDAGVASYSGGYFFGFSLRELTYRYYRFEPTNPTENAPALLIVKDTGQDPFYFSSIDAVDSLSVGNSPPRRRVAANVQSGTLKAYAVTQTSRESVTWSFPP